MGRVCLLRTPALLRFKRGRETGVVDFIPTHRTAAELQSAADGVIVLPGATGNTADARLRRTLHHKVGRTWQA